MIRVGIVDDHKLFRTSFSLLLSQIEEVEVVFHCANGLTLLELLKSKSIDLLFLDLHMPIMDGYQVAGLLAKHHPLIKVLVLSSSSDFYSIKRILQYPISGYLTKNSSFLALKTAIFSVNQGNVYYDCSVQQLINQLEKHKPMKHLVLSAKEVEIIQLYALQYNIKQIADQLSLSARTIEKYKQILMKKTGAKNFIGVILFAMRWHYIEDQDLD